MRKRETWISIGKAVAMCAVIFDHLKNVTYENVVIQLDTFISVPLFFMFSGATSYLSLGRGKRSMWQRLSKILAPYLVATAVYQVYTTHVFNLEQYIQYVVGFTASSPFYFIAIYIQLVLAAPLLYQLILYMGEKKLSYLLYTIAFAVLVWLSTIFIKYTYMWPIANGGRYLLGGTYVVFFYLGMVFFHCAKEWPERTLKQDLLILAPLLVVCIGWFLFIAQDPLGLDKLFPFGSGKNPTGVSVGVFSILLFGVIYFASSAAEKLRAKPLHKVMSVFVYIGDHSLYIYLYHTLVLRVLVQFGAKGWSLAVRRMVLPLAMIALPLLGEWLWNQAARRVKTAGKKEIQAAETGR